MLISVLIVLKFHLFICLKTTQLQLSLEMENPDRQMEFLLLSSFNSPINLALDSNNNIFIADFGNKGIRKIDPSGNVTNFQITDHTFSLNLGYHNDDFTFVGSKCSCNNG